MFFIQKHIVLCPNGDVSFRTVPMLIILVSMNISQSYIEDGQLTLSHAPFYKHESETIKKKGERLLIANHLDESIASDRASLSVLSYGLKIAETLEKYRQSFQTTGGALEPSNK